MRVVQRNLVYVVGLALDLCQEDTLKGPEYFGQFGRIVKVSTPACHSTACVAEHHNFPGLHAPELHALELITGGDRPAYTRLSGE